MRTQTRRDAAITKIEVAAYTIPTDAPESDGTLAWNATTLIVVHVCAAAKRGVGYTYANAAAATLIHNTLTAVVQGRDAFSIAESHHAMRHHIRNDGSSALCAAAISAVDNALWDLKARLLEVPLVTLLGAVRGSTPIYGSGGFCSYSDEQLANQLGGWASLGIPRVKMKVGREPDKDRRRARVARNAIGPNVELFVDANSAYSRKQALHFCCLFAEEFDARWMEQPLAPEDVAGMSWLRAVGPPQLDITDGEYGYDLPYFRRRLEAGAVDVLMADATRCGGISGLLGASALCEAFEIPLSTHCAPALHAHPGSALPSLRHAEYFHDHARIEEMLFDGVLQPQNGALVPDVTRPGFGLEFKEKDAEKFRT
jgi:L-alanine-DL-glutamate epimerase-like enolase superfamily enzyme